MYSSRKENENTSNKVENKRPIEDEDDDDVPSIKKLRVEADPVLSDIKLV